MPPKRPISPEDSQVFISEPIHDRKSVFIAYYLPDTTTPKSLQSLEDVKSASHRALAWRQPSDQKTLFQSAKVVYNIGHDDDGEQWAGKRIEKIMEEMDVKGALMVARWYGGEMLGPVRFKHIEDVAKEAVNAWKQSGAAGGVKKQRVAPADTQANGPPVVETMRPEELQRRKKELVQELQQRDESIVTLRALLDQKRGPSGSQNANSSPNRPPHYAGMPFARLQALDKARDATISFILKQIDQAEQEQTKCVEEARVKAVAETQLKKAQDDLEIEDAWDEMEEAMLAAQEKASQEKALQKPED